MKKGHIKIHRIIEKHGGGWCYHTREVPVEWYGEDIHLTGGWYLTGKEARTAAMQGLLDKYAALIDLVYNIAEGEG